MTKLLTSWGPVALWAAVLFLLSSLPDWGETLIVVNDKLVHLGLYAVFGATLAHAHTRSKGGIAHWILILVGSTYGAGDEWHQSFVPGRSPQVSDWIADSAGVLIGYAALFWALSAASKRQPAVQSDDRR